MATVTGPFLSLQASGSLAGVITSLNCRGAATMRRLAPQANRPSAAKTTHRQMFSFLLRTWPSLTLAEKTTWEPAAELAEFTPANAYTAENLRRWNQFLPPLKSAP